MIVDAVGVPLLASHTGANRNDVTQLLALVDGIGTIAGKCGRPRQRPDRVIADRGYDHDKYRRALWARGVKPVIARRGTAHGSGLGRWALGRRAHLRLVRSRRKLCSQAKVRSTTQRQRPTPEPCAVPRRAMTGLTPRAHSARRYLSGSAVGDHAVGALARPSALGATS